MKRFTILFSVLLMASVVFGQTFQANQKIKPFNTTNTNKAVVGTLQWCLEVLYTGIGTNSAGTFACAAEFDAADLTAYNGNYITKIHVGIANSTVITSGKVAILTGTLTGTPVIAYQQAATFVDGWNEIMLTIPYQINSATPIYVAYEVTCTGGYPLGFDEGPANVKGNWISTGGLSTGWSHLTALNAALVYNGLIKATVDDNGTAIAMTAAPTDAYFIGYVGSGATASENIVVQAVGLTTGISATATAGFEISSDNTTFASTATLPSTGGTLYSRFIPAATYGQTTGTVTFTSTGVADVVVNLTGITYDCQGVVTAPYTEDFVSEKSGCWTVIDANADGAEFILYYSDATQTDLAYMYPYSSVNAGDDWLISPLMTVPSNPLSSFQYKVANATTPYPEKYEVYVITGTPQNYAAGTQIVATQTVTNVAFATQTLDLSAYAGQDIYVGIKCVSDADMYYLYIDNFILDIGSSVATNNVNAVSVYPNPANDVIFVSETANITVINMVGQVVATANNATQVNVSELPAGNYIVKVQNENVNSVQKINIVK